jgi:hypothetical protein
VRSRCSPPLWYERDDTSGLILGALAFALPQVKRLFEVLPPWLIACGALGMLIVIKWPRAIGVVLPILVALWYLGPRHKKAAPAKGKPRRKVAAK